MDNRLKKRVEELHSCFGGFWRWPDVLDYYYLVNPYFPPKRLAKEFKNAFFDLLTQYPSGMRVNAKLAARNFHVDPARIVVGNGASELIKSLMERIESRIGFVYPSFEEYPNRVSISQRVPYYIDSDNFTYTVDDLMEYFGRKGNQVQALALVNPDNPSGNLINRKDMMRLIEWTKSRSIRLIVDESFVDFADHPYTLIKNRVLSDNPHLVVIKSISKSYGVPGLRLGVLASGDEELIAWMKKDVAIWNVNSFAEYYMQLAPKYTDDFKKSYEMFRKERNRFFEELKSFKFLRMIPTQANYFLAEVLPPFSAESLACCLFEAGKVLAKKCDGKKGFEGKNYLRITIRNTVDNNRFINALRTLA